MNEILPMVANIQLDLAKLYNRLTDKGLGRAANDIDLVKVVLNSTTKRMKLEAKRRKKYPSADNFLDLLEAGGATIDR